MKRSTLKFFLSMAAVMGVATSASADLLYTFDTSATSGTQGGTWASDGVGQNQVAWSSTYSSVQVLPTSGGWTPGPQAGKFELSWPAQSVMWDYRADPHGYVTMDLTVAAESVSYINYTGDWVQWIIVGNSEAVNGGWSQNQIGAGQLLYDGEGVNYWTDTVTLTFAQMGWGPGDTWFQMYIGSNTENANGPLQFFIDNIHIVPEPGTLALLGLGAAAMLISRRRS